MSQADIERFVSDLNSDTGMMDELKSGSTGLASVVEFAGGKGYDISIDEAKAYIQEQAKQELSDDQLDGIAGGKGHHHHATNVSSNQTAVNATTVATVAEEAAEVATTVAVAAEGVIVAT
ncbi:MAG: Nif11-like leader peptide family RiPP precursor [Alphaproteobacteria bacterium]|nr:Nif11-like leader peptide family RiPP precursor [Alphaproteobacteria bacterium]